MSLPPAPHKPDELARLRADFAAQLAAQEARFATRFARLERPRRHLPRRFLPLVLTMLLLALTPLTLRAAGPFNDLTGGVHDANIQAIYDAGITTGCVPNVSYCPTDTVTRQEMASFLARTAGLGSNPPVANAKTLQGYAPSGLVRVGGVGEASTAEIAGKNNFYGKPLTLTTPAAGYVLVTAGLSVQWYLGGSAVAYSRLFHVQKNASSVIIGTSVSSDTVFANAAMTWVFPVDAGAQTFRISVDNGGGGRFNAYFHNMTALYVPFGSGSVSGLAQPDPPASADTGPARP